MKFLCQFFDFTRLDKEKNEEIRNKLKVSNPEEDIQKYQLAYIECLPKTAFQ
mgnify:CR=1 FL=1